MDPLQSIGNLIRIKQYKHSEINNSKNGKCSRCGKCCTNKLPLTSREISVLKRYVQRKRIKPISQQPVLPFNINSQIAQMELGCPFWDYKTRTCTIYNVKPEIRPMICRAYLCAYSSDQMAMVIRRLMGADMGELEVHYLREEVF